MFLLDLITKYFHKLSDELRSQSDILLDSNNLYNWKWYLSALTFAAIVYTIRLKSFKRVIKRAFIFLKQRRTQIEFKKDLKFFLIKILYKPFVLVFFAFNIHLLFEFITDALKASGLQIPIVFELNPYLGPVFKLIITMIIYDFAHYLSHYLLHNLMPLWFFHKIHHRATALNPLTNLRIHPLEYFFSNAIRAVVAAPFLFAFTSFYAIPRDKPLYVYILASMLISNALTHLRHSHIRIHFGILSYIFVSPVMHQAHHSILEKHYNKNLGVIFSFWDLLFGTFYLPKKNERFKFGVKDFKNKVPSLTEELFLPFKENYNHYRLKPEAKFETGPELKPKSDKSNQAKTDTAV